MSAKKAGASGRWRSKKAQVKSTCWAGGGRASGMARWGRQPWLAAPHTPATSTRHPTACSAAQPPRNPAPSTHLAVAQLVLALRALVQPAGRAEGGHACGSSEATRCRAWAICAAYTVRHALPGAAHMGGGGTAPRARTRRGGQPAAREHHNVLGRCCQVHQALQVDLAVVAAQTKHGEGGHRVAAAAAGGGGAADCLGRARRRWPPPAACQRPTSAAGRGGRV